MEQGIISEADLIRNLDYEFKEMEMNKKYTNRLKYSD